MEAAKVKKTLWCYAGALEAAGVTSGVDGLRALERTLGEAGTISTARFVSNASTNPFSLGNDGGPPLGDLVPPVSALIELLSEAAANKKLIADLVLLLDLIRRHSEVSVKEFESKANRPVASASPRKADNGAAEMDSKYLVTDYLQRLETALGDDTLFRPLFRELCADKRITKLEAVELASLFLAPTPPSTSRPKALQRVLYRHEKLMESRAASASIGGRAA